MTTWSFRQDWRIFRKLVSHSRLLEKVKTSTVISVSWSNGRTLLVSYYWSKFDGRFYSSPLHLLFLRSPSSATTAVAMKSLAENEKYVMLNAFRWNDRYAFVRWKLRVLASKAVRKHWANNVSRHVRQFLFCSARAWLVDKQTFTRYSNSRSSQYSVLLDILISSS